MIDHMSYNVSDYQKSRDFFLKALAPLGYEMAMEFGNSAAGFGVDGKPDFGIAQGEPPKDRIHVAFTCATRAQVDAFYSAAIAAGGVDHGKPGLRPNYHPNYYGAFVLDPDGQNIEAVCHTPA